jgi:hypothetical protein
MMLNLRSLKELVACHPPIEGERLKVRMDGTQTGIHRKSNHVFDHDRSARRDVCRSQVRGAWRYLAC